MTESEEDLEKEIDALKLQITELLTLLKQRTSAWQEAQGVTVKRLENTLDKLSGTESALNKTLVRTITRQVKVITIWVKRKFPKEPSEK